VLEKHGASTIRTGKLVGISKIERSVSKGVHPLLVQQVIGASDRGISCSGLRRPIAGSCLPRAYLAARARVQQVSAERGCKHHYQAYLREATGN
jgi:hypothetical protein